jgi:hypothetical protein
LYKKCRKCTNYVLTLATQFRFYIAHSPANSPANSLLNSPGDSPANRPTNNPSNSNSIITNSLITNSSITTSHFIKQPMSPNVEPIKPVDPEKH